MNHDLSGKVWEIVKKLKPGDILNLTEEELQHLKDVYADWLMG